jgi:colanic acid/amylovoran biosynthesis glycosyltransferase
MIKYTPDIEPVIAAPLIVENEFYEKEWEFIHSPFQKETVKDEWAFSPIQVKIAFLAVKTPFFYKRFLLKRLKELKPNLIHIHFGNKAWEYLEVFKELNIPFIVTFHGYDFRMIPFIKPQYKTYYKEVFKYASAVTCGGSSSKEYLYSLGCAYDKIHVMHYGVNCELIHFHNKKKEVGEIKLVQVASFVEKKGQIYTLKAFNKALKVNPDLHLTFIGEKINHNIYLELKEYVRENKLEKFVRFFDSLDYDSLLKKLKEFDVFIHPSVTAANKDTECTPVGIMDAQATGLPTISTFHADIPDVVTTGKTGILSKEKDVKNLTESILRFANMSDEEIRVWKMAARHNIETNYNIKKIGVQWKNLYQNTIQV